MPNAPNRMFQYRKKIGERYYFFVFLAAACKKQLAEEEKNLVNKEGLN